MEESKEKIKDYEDNRKDRLKARDVEIKGKIQQRGILIRELTKIQQIVKGRDRVNIQP